MKGKRSSYYEQRLAPFEYTPEELHLEGQYHTFEPADVGIIIRPVTHRGDRYSYVTDSGHHHTLIWTRNNPAEEKNRGHKYDTATGAHNVTFQNGIYQYFREGVLDKIVFTEGAFKAMYGCKKGIPVVAGAGIHNFYPKQSHKDRDERQYEFTPENQELFQSRKVKQAILLLDADATENKGNRSRLDGFIAAVLHFQEACSRAGVKGYFMHIRPEFVKEGSKGLDDLLLNRKDSAEEIRHELLSLKPGKYFGGFSLARATRRSVTAYFENYTITCRSIVKYVSEDREYLAEKIAARQDLALTLPPGSGKTDILYDITSTIPYGIRVFAFPDNLACSQKANEYSHPDRNPHGLSLDIVELNQFTSKAEKEHIGHRQVINTNFVSAQSLALTKNDVIVIDEDDTLYRRPFEENEKFVEWLHKCPAQKVFLTATPNPSFYEQFGAEQLVYERGTNPVVDAKCFELTDGRASYNLNGAQELYLKHMFQTAARLDASQPGVYLFIHNNAEHLRHFAEELNKQGTFEVHPLYSDEKIKSESTVWHALVNTGRVEVGNKPVIVAATSVLYRSTSILNEDFLGLYAWGTDDPAEMEQLVGRPRRMEKINVHWYLAANNRTKWQRSYYYYAQAHKADYERVSKAYQILQSLETVPGDKFSAPINIAKFIRPDGSHNQFDCIRSYEREKVNGQANRQKFEEITHNAHYRVTYGGVLTVEDAPQEQQIDREAGKAVRKSEKDICFAALRENFTQCLRVLLLNKIDQELRGQIKRYLGNDKFDPADVEFVEFRKQFSRSHLVLLTKIVNRCFDLGQHFTKGADTLLPMVQDYFSDHKYGLLLQQIKVLLSLAGHTQYDFQLNAAAFKSVQQAFNVGEEYSSKEIGDIIRAGFSEYRTLRLDKNKAFNLFKMIFTLRDNRVKGKYKITGLFTPEAFESFLTSRGYNVGNVLITNKSPNIVTRQEQPPHPAPSQPVSCTDCDAWGTPGYTYADFAPVDGPAPF